MGWTIDFHFFHPDQLRALPNLLSNRYCGLFPWLMWLGHGADHSPSSSAEIKNMWSYTSIPQYIFMAQCLVKYRDNFTLCFSVSLQYNIYTYI